MRARFRLSQLSFDDVTSFAEIARAIILPPASSLRLPVAEDEMALIFLGVRSVQAGRRFLLVALRKCSAGRLAAMRARLS